MADNDRKLIVLECATNAYFTNPTGITYRLESVHLIAASAAGALTLTKIGGGTAATAVAAASAETAYEGTVNNGTDRELAPGETFKASLASGAASVSLELRPWRT